MLVGPREAIANLGDCFDLERRAELAADLPNLGQNPVDGVVADNPTVPAAFDQLVAGDDCSSGAGEQDKNLHDPRFERFASTLELKLEKSRSNSKPSDAEWRFVRQHHAARYDKTVVRRFPHP